MEKLEETSTISLELISSLSRINHGSPYDKEHPIRKIDSINEIEVVAGNCGRCCVAMLASVPLEEVIKLMGKEDAS